MPLARKAADEEFIQLIQMVHIHISCLDELPLIKLCYSKDCHSKESEHTQAMTEAETRAIMKAYGWFYVERCRSGFRTKYIYAKRRRGPKMLERYVCPLSRIGNLTETELVAKLTQPPVEKP